MLKCLGIQKNLAKFVCGWKIIKWYLLGSVDYILLELAIIIENMFTFLPRNCSINANDTPFRCLLPQPPNPRNFCW
jgi:hypothetical protein